jgi:thiamine biosynthesis lipoprotein
LEVNPSAFIQDPRDPVGGVRVGVFEPLMGTSVEIRVGAATKEAAVAAEAAVVAEIQRLTDVFSVYDTGSELSRWSRCVLDEVSADLATGLALAEYWFAEGGGAFHPVCRALRRRWERAEAEGAPPTGAELRDMAMRLQRLPFRVRSTDGTASVERLGDCSDVDLDAMVKGHIVDRAVDAGFAVPGVRSLVANAGGDLRHRGDGVVTVRIEDPHRPYDNADPVTRVTLGNAALATSGSVHRGFRVGGQWFGHVIDPRTGRPARRTASASVIAPDTATADAVATVAMVLPPDEALAFVDARQDLAALLVGADGRVRQSRRWPRS